MVVLVSLNVNPTIPSGTGIKPCDWARLMQSRLQRRYPDLEIKLDDELGNKLENKLVFKMRFKNRPTVEADIRSRLYGFLRSTPAMHVENLEINAKPILAAASL